MKIFTIIVCVVLLLLAGVVIFTQQANSARKCSSFFTKLSTPALIECDFVRNTITQEQQILFLAKAVYDSKSLPKKYMSSIPWDGTEIVNDLYTTVRSPAQFCSFSINTQSELAKLIQSAVHCK